METINKKCSSLFSSLIVAGVFVLLLIHSSTAVADGYYVEIGLAGAKVPESMSGHKKLEDRCGLIFPEIVNVNCKNSQFKNDSYPFTISIGKSYTINEWYSESVSVWYTEGWKASVNTNVIGSTSTNIQNINLNITQSQHLLRTATARAIGVSFTPELRLDQKTKGYLSIGLGYGVADGDVTLPGLAIKGYPVSVHTHRGSPLGKLELGVSTKISNALTVTAGCGQMGLPLVKGKNVPYCQASFRGYFAQ